MLRRRVMVGVAAGSALVLSIPSWADPPPVADGGLAHQPVCPSAPSGFARCLSAVVTNGGGQPVASTVPTGLGPATIESVYGFATGLTAGTGQKIGIVDAYDDPTAEHDLGVFSTQ